MTQCRYCFTLRLGADGLTPRIGSYTVKQETADFVLMVVSVGLSTFLFTMIGYSKGWRDGHSEGYVRGRAIAKALTEAASK